jgi:hypothetical protein
MLLAFPLDCKIRVIDSIPQEVVVNTKSLFQKALALCVVGTFGILGASCGSDGSECPSGQINTEDGCVPVQNDGGMDDGGMNDMGEDTNTNTCSEAETCIQNSCGSIDGENNPGELATCLSENCSDPISTCPEFSGNSCSDLASCLGDCEQGDDQCSQACADASGIIGLQRYNARVACLEENNCEAFGSACEIRNCSDTYYTCVPEASPGDATCDTSFECAIGSKTGSECEENATKEGQIDFAEMVSCMNDEGCLSQEGVDLACMVSNCYQTVDECGLTGDNSCSGVNACQQTAGSQEDALGCFFTMSAAEVATEFQSLNTCISDNCSETQAQTADRVQCVSSECSSEANTCGVLGDTTNCSEMWNCAQDEISECAMAENGAEFLFSNYIYAGSAQEQQNFYSVTSCFQENCPDNEDTCLEQECGDEIDACGFTLSN